MSIRTYSRKRPQHQVIEDVHSRCRLCLMKAERPLPIFTQQTDVCALAIRIMICVGLEITNEECLPNIVCSNCREMLEQYYNFRKICEVSYQKLKSHQAAINMMSYKEELKVKEPVKQSKPLPQTQRLRIEEAKDIYFKLDSDGIVQILYDENSKKSFNNQKLVSIVKVHEPLKKNDHNIVTDDNTNTQIHPKNSFDSQCDKSNTNENNKHCDKVIMGSENMEITQSDKLYETNEGNIEVSTEGKHNIIDLSNTEVEQTNSIIDNNTKNIIYSDSVNSAKDTSTVGVNHLVPEPIVPTNETTNNMEVLDVEHVVIDNNAVMDNSEIAHERRQGNLVINEMDTNEVAEDGLINVIGDNQVDLHNSDTLTTMLLGLGVLTRRGDSLLVRDCTRARTVALETGDGNQFTLEFVEEPAAGQNIEEVTADDEEKSDPFHKNEIGKDFTRMVENKVCGTCGKRFASNSGMKRHVRSVHGKHRPHQCRVCGRSFAQKEVMLRHELVHSESRPFQCVSCPKSFTQRNALHTHARSHAPPHSRALELYPCVRCPKVFLYPSGLSRHTKTHSGRVFICGGCQKAFKDKSSLKRHMVNTKHGQTVPVATDAQPATDTQVQST